MSLTKKEHKRKRLMKEMNTEIFGINNDPGWGYEEESVLDKFGNKIKLGVYCDLNEDFEMHIETHFEKKLMVYGFRPYLGYEKEHNLGETYWDYYDYFYD